VTQVPAFHWDGRHACGSPTVRNRTACFRAASRPWMVPPGSATALFYDTLCCHADEASYALKTSRDRVTP